MKVYLKWSLFDEGLQIAFVCRIFTCFSSNFFNNLQAFDLLIKVDPDT